MDQKKNQKHRVFFLCLLAGCSICWFNTVCFVLCIQNFPSNRALALSLTVGFNGVSAALYALAGNAIDPSSKTVYLLLNALVPVIISLLSLFPFVRQPSLDPLSPDGVRRDSLVFMILNLIALLTGIYLLLFGSNQDVTRARPLFAEALFLLVFPSCIPGVVYARDWFHRNIHSSFPLEDSAFNLVDIEDLELHKELLTLEWRERGYEDGIAVIKGASEKKKGRCACKTIVGKDRLVMLGEEHPARVLVRRLDFWLYYITYFCGGTIGLIYSNNLGQIAESLGQSSNTTTLLTLYSSFSFLGRLLAAAPDYVRRKVYIAKTAWLAIALLPTPIAFFLLAASGSGVSLRIGTALVGLSSGFIFAAAVSVTSELFGPNSIGFNHNILITNIPIGSLVYGVLAAIVYDSNATFRPGLNMASELVECMGRWCYLLTFVRWGWLLVCCCS